MRPTSLSDRLKDDAKQMPAQVLRAVFAGIGLLLLVSDQLRRRWAAAAAYPADGARSTPVLVDRPAPADLGDRPASEERIVRRDDPIGDPHPPLPHYDELSVPSLRARLRVLDVAQLRELIAYERAHAQRPEVIAMFERRVAKLTAADD